jgi:soluble lytic murein transglycosylase-like protein
MRYVIILLLGFVFAMLALTSMKNTTYATTLEVNVLYPIDVNFENDSITWETEVNLFASMLQKAYGLELEEAKKYSKWILEASTYSENVSPIQISGVIRTESSFIESAKSVVGAVGLMQIRPKYWSEFCGDIYIPKQNIMCGVKILDLQIDKYCNEYNTKQDKWECGLAHYNIGRGNLISKYNFYKGARKRYIAKNSNYTEQLQEVILITEKETSMILPF